MDSGSPFTSGNDDDEPDGHDDAPQRGWISPDDRLWRHPSELASGAPAPSSPDHPLVGHDRRAAMTAGAVGAVVVVVAVATALALTGTSTRVGTGPVAITVTSITSTSASGSATGTFTGGPPAGSDTTTPNVIAMVSELRPSIVGVIAAGDSTSSDQADPAVLTGVVLPGGKLVVTAASAVVGMHDVDVVTWDGKYHPGVVTGADERSGVAVVSVDDPLLAASFAADDDVSVGTLAVAACLCGGVEGTNPATSMPTVSIGKVSAAGQSETMADGTDLIDTIEASMPLLPGSWGTVLLDRGGEVIGILDSEEQGGGVTTGVFVPSSLAVDVADALAGGHDLVHGWLGIVCADPQSPTGQAGPVVTSLLADGPASLAGIEPGDVIQAVDGLPVTTLAELQARLYTATPGTTVLLTTFRGSAERDVPVTLSSEPG